MVRQYNDVAFEGSSETSRLLMMKFKKVAMWGNHSIGSAPCPGWQGSWRLHLNFPWYLRVKPALNVIMRFGSWPRRTWRPPLPHIILIQEVGRISSPKLGKWEIVTVNLRIVVLVLWGDNAPEISWLSWASWQFTGSQCGQSKTNRVRVLADGVRIL